MLTSELARRIAESDVAAEELTGFLREISTPALAVKFPAGSVEDVTSLKFPFLFSGVSTVADTTIAGNLPSTERLRAYLKIKDLLNEKRVAEINGENSSSIEQAALRLSLEYNFVTELTSLIVVEKTSNMTTTALLLLTAVVMLI